MQNAYETDSALNTYLLFHYGSAEDQLPYSFGPHEALFYPIRCVTEFVNEIGPIDRALDLGCSVGRSTFELARYTREVVGIDLSSRFITAAQQIRETGEIKIHRCVEGIYSLPITRHLPAEISRSRCRFEIGDATRLSADLGKFDLVLAANLLDRVHSPRALLDACIRGTAVPGHLILASPYTWLTEYAPPDAWLGGKRAVDGTLVTTLQTLESILAPAFELVRAKDLPFLISETIRKYQWSVAQASLWRRRKEEVESRQWAFFGCGQDIDNTSRPG
jgi:putative 4-mercaptohistidine N1-methyltranferase